MNQTLGKKNITQLKKEEILSLHKKAARGNRPSTAKDKLRGNRQHPGRKCKTSAHRLFVCSLWGVRNKVKIRKKMLRKEGAGKQGRGVVVGGGVGLGGGGVSVKSQDPGTGWKKPRKESQRLGAERGINQGSFQDLPNKKKRRLPPQDL